MRVNKLRATLKAGGIALGTIMWETRARGVLHTLAQAGMDFVFICMEHSAYNLETVTEMVAHAHAAAITPVVRIPDLQYQYVTRLLDSGCQSLIAPHLRSGEEARRFIEYAKYYPEGRRGMAILNNAGVEYESVEPRAAITHANANTLLAVLIETREAVTNAEEILIPGIDLVLVGHQDLAQSFGVPGEFGHPEVRAATARVNALCKARGIAIAGAINHPENVKAVVDTGAQFLLYGTDLLLIRREAERAAQALAPYRKARSA
ncbi:MAG TPA: aldolase/citrate lyase family protein [Candidatus Binataceae bacterium]|nr:aldolase/citrate lyase family protein [Candidatus Binataceae bacterium]